MNIQQAILANPNATDAEILAIVNAPVAKRIKLDDVRKIALRSGLNLKLRELSANKDDKAAAAIKALDLFASGLAYIEVGFEHEDFVADLGKLAAELSALTFQIPEAARGQTVSVLQALQSLAFNVPEYTLADVAHARRIDARNALAAQWSAIYNAGVTAIDNAHQNGDDFPTLLALREVTV
jgi:hypothetical protein